MGTTPREGHGWTTVYIFLAFRYIFLSAEGLGSYINSDPIFPVQGEGREGILGLSLLGQTLLQTGGQLMIEGLKIPLVTRIHDHELLPPVEDSSSKSVVPL